MEKDMGGTSGSHAAHEAPSGLRPSGFDPGHWTPFTYAHGYPDAFHPEITVWRYGQNGREINGSKPTKVIQLYSLDQVREIVAEAIAGEARSGETVEQGSTGTASTRAEGIAQTPHGDS